MLTYGFYNSVNRDRRYDAEQIGALFDGLINDGVYANYKEALKIVPGSGNRQIVIRPGRAWFNGTWTLVDDSGHSFYITGSQVETTYYIYLYVGKNDRRNSISWYSEVQQNDPEGGKFFYLMGQVTIPAGVNAITEDMIVDLRGSTHCPFVTGILETADFERIVRETCGENWLLWLNSYEAGLDAKVEQIQAIANKADTSADLAIATVHNLRHLAYRWAKYHAILVQGGSLGWVLAIDTPDSYGEPPERILYRELTFDGVNYTLSDPISTTGVSAADQYANYRSAPYFNGDGYGGTVVGNVYRYERMTENVKMSGNSVTITYGYRISCAKLVEGTYEPGAYIETVEAKYASEYPLDGYKGGYWYTRFASRASDVFFDNTRLPVPARTVQEAIEALYKTGGTGNEDTTAPSCKAVYPDWSHLKWYVLGDSLTDPDSTIHTSKFYYEYIQEKTGIQVIVDGVGGTGYYAGVSTNRRFADRVPNIPADVDIVTIFGSGNDISHGYDNYKSAMSAALKPFYNERPGLPVILIPPSPWKGYQKRGEEWVQYCDTLKLIALNYNARYVSDMFDCPPFDPNSESQLNAFFTKDTVNGIHPDENGHKAIARYIYNAMLQELAFGKDLDGGV